MLKRNIFCFILSLVLLTSFLNIYTCNEEVDDIDLGNYQILISIDADINIPKTKYLVDEDDEFDNPNLLVENQGKNIGKPAPEIVNSNSNNINKQNIQIPSYDSQNQKPTNPGNNSSHQVEPQLYLAYYEIVMFLFVVAFFLNLYIGKSRNEAIATKWYTTNQKFFEDNYAHIGVNSEYNTKAGVPILKESYNNFKFYSSGRVFTKWMLVNIDLKKRQDLVSLFTSLFLFNDKDRIIYESTLTPPQDIPLVFCLCKKKDVKSMKKSYSDIDYFTKPNNPYFMSDSLVLLTEDNEILEQIFNDKDLLAVYKRVEPFIDIVYFTDRQTYTKEKQAIFFSFDLSNCNDIRSFNSGSGSNLLYDLTYFVHIFIDILSSSRISTNFLKQSEKSRVEYNKIIAKELQEKNAEDVRQKKLEKLDSKYKKNLTVEQAQKLEEKEKKEQLKNQKKKQMKVVKK